MSGECISSSLSADGGDDPPSTRTPPTSPGAEPTEPRPSLSVGVIGVCGSGKSTLVAGLRRLGYEARQIAQEHSYVPDLWCRFSCPDVLVHLEAADATVESRIGPLLHRSILPAQRLRLAEARARAQIRVDTDGKNAEEVLSEVLAAIRSLPAMAPYRARRPPRPG